MNTGQGCGVRGPLAAAGVLVATWCGTMSASAQDWGLTSSLSEEGTYNSNLELTPTGQVSAFGSTTTPELTLSRSTPSSHAILHGRFPIERYFGHSDLDTENQFLNLSLDQDLSERSTVSLLGDFNHATTLTSDEDLTGQFLVRPSTFISWDVAPTWTYLLSPIDRIDWQASYKAVNFDLPTKTDYQYYGTALNYAHQLSEVAQVTGSLSYFRFDTDDVLNTKNQIYGFLVGYAYKPTQRFSIDGSVGADYETTERDQSTSTVGRTDNTLGYRLKFDMNYTLSDQTQLGVTLSHDAEPSGDGQLQTRNRGNIQLQYQFDELTFFQLQVVYADDQDYFGTESQSNSGTTRYYAIGPSLNWNIRDDLTLQASYQLRYKSSKSAGSATDNAAFLTLRYALPDLHWSGF